MTTRTKRLEAMAGRPLRLVAAAARDPKKQRDAGGVTVTQDVFAILDDPGVHVVVEVIGGTSPARDLQLAAFERGKHVVTANKELVAKEWKALHEAARVAKRELRFEAAVAAAVPAGGGGGPRPDRGGGGLGERAGGGGGARGGVTTERGGGRAAGRTNGGGLQPARARPPVGGAPGGGGGAERWTATAERLSLG